MAKDERTKDPDEGRIPIITDSGIEETGIPTVPTGVVEVSPEDTKGEVIVPKTEEKDDLKDDVEDTPKDDLKDDEPEKDDSKEEKSEEKTDSLEEDEKEDKSQVSTVTDWMVGEGLIDEVVDDESDIDSLRLSIEKTIENKIEEYKDQFNNPVAKDFINFVENGGDAYDFINLSANTNHIDIDESSLEGESNIALQKKLLGEYYVRQGDEPDEIADNISAFEDTGKLEVKAKLALKKMKKQDQDAYNNALKEQEAQKKNNAEEVNAYLSELKENITKKDEIAGFSLNKKQKTDFYNYMTKLDKDNTTQLIRDAQDEENRLKMAFFYFNKFNFDKVERKVKTKEAMKLEEKLSRFSDTRSKGSGSGGRKKVANPSKEGAPNFAIMDKFK